MTTTLLPASILPGLLEVSLRSQQDIPALFERLGIDVDIVGRSDRFISLAQLDELLFSAFMESDDPLFGLRIGADNHYGNLDLLGNLMATAETLEAGLAMLFRYKDLLVPYLHFQLTLDNGLATLAVESDGKALRFTGTRVHNDLVVATMVAIGRSMLASAMPLEEVLLAHARPDEDDLASYQRFFQCPVRFSAPANAVVFPQSLLETPLPRAFPKYHERLKRSADQVMSGLSRAEGVAGKVLLRMQSQLGQGEITIDVVAASLAMSPRTLQRRLKEEGTRFATLRDQVKHRHACEMLAGSDCDMGVLAQRLGFSDTANFYHAFKRWQGCAPGEYRRRNGGG
ncbi:AraC family transcriptional regulator [Alcanivorax sp. S6407]|uniref:AraC family transcriptional regulator n=1 Tax=Alcanivorax sp. S6407 TaxID=2926424 RepID=UPI001FF67627|nr:AraC family transcriptional regulator [Alcanivorax sp. S6407]MCK0152231.1 AraC family transcriptional regulator [Alcanivorax sp. S6407]